MGCSFSSSHRNIKSYKVINKYFIACLNGDLITVQRMYNTTLKKNPEKAKKLAERGFIDGCLCGHMFISEWLLNNARDLDIHVEDDAAFRVSCINENKKIVEWLLQLGGVNIHCRNDSVFKNLLLAGKLEMCKFIYSLDGENIKLDWNELFIILCKNTNNSKVMADYLYSIRNKDIDRTLYLSFLHPEIID
jgi:hypothetical protein